MIAFNTLYVKFYRLIQILAKRLCGSLRNSEKNKKSEITPCHSLKTQILQLNTAGFNFDYRKNVKRLL